MKQQDGGLCPASPGRVRASLLMLWMACKSTLEVLSDIFIAFAVLIFYTSMMIRVTSKLEQRLDVYERQGAVLSYRI